MSMRMTVTAVIVALVLFPVSLTGVAAEKPEPSPEKELTDYREKYRQQVDQINRVNPFSDQFQKETAPPPQNDKIENRALADLIHLLSKPAVQDYLALFKSPKFSEGMDRVVRHPNRYILFYIELGFMVLMMFLRSWKLARVHPAQGTGIYFVKRLWVNLWTAALFWIGFLAIIPAIVLGQSYVDTLTGLWHFFQNSVPLKQ